MSLQFYDVTMVEDKGSGQTVKKSIYVESEA
jgi:hypothetical protein